jgi:hypothetical protein
MSSITWRSALQVAVFETARSLYFSLVIISVTVQLWIQVFWVILVYFNIRNTLPKFGTFLLGHSVYIVVHHCRNSRVLSLLSGLLALFWSACVSYLCSFFFSYFSSVLLRWFVFSTHDVHQKDRKEAKSKQLTLHSFLVSSEPRPGPSSTK